MSVTIGKRRTRNTFEPRLAIRLATYRFTPEIRATTMISVETDSTIPSSIRKERILCARSVSSATKNGSRNWIRVFMNLRWPTILYEQDAKKIHPRGPSSDAPPAVWHCHRLSHGGDAHARTACP